jgi:predicted  nucleic acid-binding Zn-ribbon protein
VGFGSNLYFQLKGEEESLRVRLDTLQLRYTDLSASTLAHQQDHVDLDKSITERLETTNKKIEAVDRESESSFVSVYSQMSELANHSNVEVLHQLNVTQMQVTQALLGVKETVATNLGDLSKNVTYMLALSDKSIKGLGSRVAIQLNSTLLRMRAVAQEASLKIAQVQSNVTTQLSFMDQTLVHTRNELNVAVDEARTAIHQEVQTVRDNIDQYVSVTNKQFAAENDFVKYQLAGQCDN